MLDMVRDDFCLYVCKKETKGHKPSEDIEEVYWMKCTDKVNPYTESDVQEAFNYVFGGSGTDPDIDLTAMTAADVNEAISHAWLGESSTDEEAMTSTDVEDSTSKAWDGSSSTDPEAMKANDVENATH